MCVVCKNVIKYKKIRERVREGGRERGKEGESRSRWDAGQVVAGTTLETDNKCAMLQV